MPLTDARFSEAVEAAVTRLEEDTDAEIVIVAARRSGSYADLSLLVGFAIAWAFLVVVVWSPLEFSGSWLPVELPLLGFGAGWLAARTPILLRTLAGAPRRRRQVLEAARAAFLEEAVHGTRGRTGILIYLSILEDQVLLLPDAGIEAVVPGAEWNAIRWGTHPDARRPGDLDHFLKGLDSVGAVLAARLPSTDDNPDEIANAPRIRS